MRVVGSREFPAYVVLQSCTSSTREIFIVDEVASENRADLVYGALKNQIFVPHRPVSIRPRLQTI